MDLYAFEAEPPLFGESESRSDVWEVRNYVRALEYGLERLAELPISQRLLREIHAVLMEGVRGERRDPGEFRRVQNWIGPPGAGAEEATFVPSPPGEIPDALSALERYVHDEIELPPLVDIALVHYQFEAIHPVLDGNGRVGRLLISLMLYEDEVLEQPLLYLSYCFKQHRAEYYRLLDAVRTDGDWEAWLDFFLESVETTAGSAVDTVHRLLALFGKDATRVQALGRAAANALRVFEAFRDRPLATIPALTQQTGTSYPTVSRAVDALRELSIVREITGKKRQRVFAYTSYLDILTEGTEPL